MSIHSQPLAELEHHSGVLEWVFDLGLRMMVNGERSPQRSSYLCDFGRVRTSGTVG